MNKRKPLINYDGIRKVGRYYEDPKRAFAYMDIKFDRDMWVDSSKYLPGDFDLCYCKGKEKTLSGWHNGTSWDGSRITPDFEVLYWKMNYDN